MGPEPARRLLLCMSSGGTSTPLRRHSSRSILQLASDSCACMHALSAMSVKAQGHLATSCLCGDLPVSVKSL